MSLCMPAKKPGYSVRLWVTNEDLERLKKLSEVTELSQVEIMTRILHAGVVACANNGNRIALPLSFEIQDTKLDRIINETSPPKRK